MGSAVLVWPSQSMDSVHEYGLVLYPPLFFRTWLRESMFEYKYWFWGRERRES